MIINAAERFSQRSSASWFQKLSGQKKHLSGNVISLYPRTDSTSKSTSGTDLVCDADVLTPLEMTQLRDSASLLVTHCDEITVHFYQNVIKTIWWNHSRFKDVVDCEKDRLLSSLVALAEVPTETSQMAFFLADNWVKYRYMGDIGESYDTITYFLNNAIDDVLGEYFTRDLSVVWRKVLAPDHVFSRTLNAHTS